MEVWQAFILGVLVALVVLSLVYMELLMEAQEKAYRKGLKDGKSRKSNGNAPRV